MLARALRAEAHAAGAGRGAAVGPGPVRGPRDPCAPLALSPPGVAAGRAAPGAIAAVKAVRLPPRQKDRSTVILREAAQVLARRLLIARARARACFRIVGIDAEGVGIICGADADGGTREASLSLRTGCTGP